MELLPRQLANPDVKHELIGNSALMRELIRFIGRAARANATVLILGESGTGKELVAGALHRNSLRSAGPFVAVNCAAVPENLIESEFFGHEKGSFNGADALKKGKFELAAGGTLFLDEAGELSLPIQAKLLRALQERHVDRIGGMRPIPTDIRLIAATNCDLESAVAEGSFREDLYYRLNVLSVRTPALRDRREDIPALIRHFLFKHAKEGGGRVVLGTSEEADAILRRYDWPGNVRQLENVIERAVVLGSTKFIVPEDLPREVFRRSPLKSKTLEGAVLDVQREFVENALELAGGSQKKAAAILDRHPKGMNRLLKKLKLKQGS